MASVVLSTALTATLLPTLDAGAASANVSAAASTPALSIQAAETAVSRAEFLKRVVDVLQLPLKNEPGSAFRDTRNHWIEARGYIDAALKAGLIAKGSQFHPDRPISRQAAAAILVRAVKTKHKLPAANHVPPYLDGAQVSEPFYSDVNWAAWLGLLNGRNSRLQPNKALTTPELAAIVAKLKTIIQQKQLPAPPIYPLSKIQPGMSGVVQTVIQGQKVESIPVRVIDVLPGQGTGGIDVILVRGTGPVLERSHGFASGMSGSPLYIDGKIAGAVALAFEDEKMAGITPIEAMLKGMPKPNAGTAAELDKPITIQGRTYTRLEIAETRDDNRTAQPGTLRGYTLPVPLMVSGFSAPAFNRLQNTLQQKGLTAVNAGSTGSDKSSAPSLGRSLLPGDSMGVGIAVGDLEAYAIGTVTYVDNGRIIGFGHPLFWHGKVNLPITEAYITTVMKGASGLWPPYKIGYIGKTVGTLTEDRAAAVGGLLGQTPNMVPMTVAAKDLNRGTEVQLKLQLAQFKNYLSQLPAAAASESILRAVDRISQGTAWITIEVETEELGTIRRSDMLFDSWDVSFLPYFPLYQLMNILLENPYQEVTIKSIRVHSEVKEANQTAQLLGVELDDFSGTVRQGEIVRIPVKVQPWRQPAQTVTIPLQIPADLAPGTYEVRVYGGASNSMGGYYYDGVYYYDASLPGDDRPETLQEMVDEFVKAPRGNDIVFEFMNAGMAPDMPVDLEASAIDEEAMKAMVPISVTDGATNGKPARVTASTAWVLNGMIPETITIEVTPGTATVTPGEDTTDEADDVTP